MSPGSVPEPSTSLPPICVGCTGPHRLPAPKFIVHWLEPSPEQWKTDRNGPKPDQRQRDSARESITRSRRSERLDKILRLAEQTFLDRPNETDELKLYGAKTPRKGSVGGRAGDLIGTATRRAAGRYDIAPPRPAVPDIGKIEVAVGIDGRQISFKGRTLEDAWALKKGTWAGHTTLCMCVTMLEDRLFGTSSANVAAYVRNLHLELGEGDGDRLRSHQVDDFAAAVRDEAWNRLMHAELESGCPHRNDETEEYEGPKPPPRKERSGNTRQHNRPCNGGRQGGHRGGR